MVIDYKRINICKVIIGIYFSATFMQHANRKLWANIFCTLS